MSSVLRRPCSCNMSGLMNSRSPANAESALYGQCIESTVGGFNGNICQYFWAESLRKSAKRYAAGPMSPEP